MHRWGDNDVDWNGIESAAQYIHSFCTRWARMGGQSKEKYGTVRFYTHFGYMSLHSLIYPNYVYSQFPKWLWVLDINYISPFLQKFIQPKFIKWQMYIYNKAYWNALYKWPHLRAEILSSADFLEHIKGVTRKEGNDTHVLGWNGEIITTWTTVGKSNE